MKARIYFCVFLMIGGYNLFAQDSIKVIGGYTYGKYGNSWYTTNRGNKADLVDLGHLIVRLISHGAIQNFDFKKI